MDEMQIWIDLGGVLEAHKNRAYRREQAKKSRDEAQQAKKQASRWGMFEDCGDSYQSASDEAEGCHQATWNAKVDAEKNFKKLKLTFLETYPGRAELILATYLPGFQADADHD